MSLLIIVLLFAVPIFVFGSYIIEKRKWYIIINVLGFTICLLIFFPLISTTIMGAYMSEQRDIENYRHGVILAKIKEALDANDYESAINILNIYHEETNDSDFMMGSLGTVLRRMEEAQQVDAGKADPKSDNLGSGGRL